MNEDSPVLRRLYRSRQERVIAGVAGGLGQYLGIDPILVRLAFVILTLTSGIGLIAYIVLALIMPQRPLGEPEPVVTMAFRGERGRELAGFALLGLGLVMLAGTMGLFRLFDLGRLWPVFLIAAGILLIVRRTRE